MISKWTAALSALALAATAIAPSSAFAYDHRGYGRYGHYHHYGRGDAAVAAGAVGLILGLAVGSALSNPGPRRYGDCYNCAAPPPPPQSYGGYDPYYGPPPSDGYYNKSSDDRRADYEHDYGQAPPREDNPCLEPRQQYDATTGRNVWVNVRTC